MSWTEDRLDGASVRPRLYRKPHGLLTKSCSEAGSMWILSPLLRCARPGEPEEDAREPYLGVDQDGLLASQSFIEEFSGTCDVTAEALGPTAGSQHGHLGKAAAPTDVSVTVPKDYMPGTPLRAAGPFGDVNLKPPPGAKAGEVLRFRLGPSIQFRVTVPPWARGGYEARFALDCGEVVSVKVPDGLQPGDSFEVLPPAMMVKVPAGAKPGDKVVFWSEAKGSGCPEGWYRFQLQEAHTPGAVLSVRIPPPSELLKSGALLPPAAPEAPLPRVSANAIPGG
ncbi:unnamed protein product [Effrenium voratum]|uniref:Uncharacterized protein n=1 Tax=Effrenium voratum TaxID=2562239 RepID=A0AA36JG99_9DINO|nr:unnamed protein product [Effrenium voratum]